MLREKLGGDRFFALLRTWTTAHRHGSATSEQFVSLANKVAGQDLTGFFDAWIYSIGRPSL